MPRLHAFIICWSGREEAARAIAAAIQAEVEFLTVVYSNDAAVPESGAGIWVRVPNAHFFGRKFEFCLHHFAGDVMLMIQADASCGDWKGLAGACRRRFAGEPLLGIWSPEVDFTPWATDKVQFGKTREGDLAFVANTDAIVWGLAGAVVARMRGLNYEGNNLGWGVELLAMAHAMTNNLLAVRDLSVHVAHPRGTGYDRAEAERQGNAFLEQASTQERLQLMLLVQFFRARFTAAAVQAGQLPLAGASG